MIKEERIWRLRDTKDEFERRQKQNEREIRGKKEGKKVKNRREETERDRIIALLNVFIYYSTTIH